LAESSNQRQTAATIYAETLNQQPANELLAERAFVTAIEVGNFDLAAKAVRALQAHGSVAPEMPLVIYADAFARRDWNDARMAIAELEALGNFAFLAPLLEAWLDIAAGRDATAALARAQSSSTAKYYLEEQLILIKLAGRQERYAIALLAGTVERNEPRMAPLRIMAARHFWAKNDPAAAMEILKLQSSGPEQRLLRSIETGQKKEIAQKVTPAVGLGFLFQRLSGDTAVQQAEFLSQLMAQAGARVTGQSDYSHLTLGRAYAANESHDLAVTQYARIGAESPYHLIALSSQISSLVTTGQYDQALARLDSAITANSDSPELHVLKGQVLQAQGENRAAADAYQAAIVLGNKLERSDALMANYWLALGGAQEQADIWPAGLQSLQKANELLPESPTILNYLGYAQLERRENKDAAVAAIKRAHELRSDSPAITDSLGWAYFITGEHERAVTYLERALEGEPQDPTINEHLGDAYWTVGRQYEARYAWKSAKLFAEGENAERLASKIDLGLRPELVSP